MIIEVTKEELADILDALTDHISTLVREMRECFDEDDIIYICDTIKSIKALKERLEKQSISESNMKEGEI